MHDERCSGLKALHILFFVETYCCSELFIDNLIITFFGFSFLDSFCDPFTKLEMFSINGRINSEFEKFFTFPEFFRFQSFYFSHFWSEMFLIFIVIIGNILTVMCGVSVFIENEFAKIIVFENILSVRCEPVVDRDDSLSECMNKPFGLQLQFRLNIHRMLKQFDLGFLRIKQPPHRIPFQIGIMLGSVIQSSFSSGYDFSLL